MCRVCDIYEEERPAAAPEPLRPFVVLAAADQDDTACQCAGWSFCESCQAIELIDWLVACVEGGGRAPGV